MICAQAFDYRKRCQDPHRMTLRFIILRLSGRKAKTERQSISFYAPSHNLQMFTSKTFPQIQVELNDPDIAWSPGNEDQALFSFNWEFKLRLRANAFHASRV